LSAGGFFLVSVEALSEEIVVREAKESDLEEATRGLEQQIRERTQSLTDQLERVIREMVEREKAEQRLQVEKEHAQVTLRSIADGVITTDARGRINAMNPAAERLLGCSSADAQGRAIGEVYLVHDETNGKPLPNPVETALREQKTVQRGEDALYRRTDGKQFTFRNCAAPIHSPSGGILGAVLVFSDNTRYHQLARELAYQAKHDALTGVFNRRHFEFCLKESLTTVKEGKISLVLAYMNLDQFKVINDTCGHLAGDELLRQVALLLPQALRKEDVLARLGGDEFWLLLRDCTAQQAWKIASELLEKIQTFRFVWESRTFRVTLSIGLVISSPARQTPAKMLSAADAACYLAKDHGRNRIHLFDDSDRDLIRQVGEMEWVSRIQEALNQGAISAFQASGSSRCFPIGVKAICWNCSFPSRKMAARPRLRLPSFRLRNVTIS
jgi:diguanylate cyclase (GGDEF)-like protein/PAS domain S-box-containing protein